MGQQLRWSQNMNGFAARCHRHFFSIFIFLEFLSVVLHLTKISVTVGSRKQYLDHRGYIDSAPWCKEELEEYCLSPTRDLQQATGVKVIETDFMRERGLHPLVVPVLTGWGIQDVLKCSLYLFLHFFPKISFMHDILWKCRIHKITNALNLQPDSSCGPQLGNWSEVKSQNIWCETDQGTPSLFLKARKHLLKKEENRIIWYHKTHGPQSAGKVQQLIYAA